VARQTVQASPPSPSTGPVNSPTATPATQTATTADPVESPAALSTVAAQKVVRSASIVASTPGRLRLLSLVLLVSLVAASTAGWISTTRRLNATNRLRQNTAPAVLAIERVRSSLAEADSAASTNFLVSKFGDRQQTRAYENAMARIATSLEEASRRIGNDDKSHELIALLDRKIITYASLIESAKTELLVSSQTQSAATQLGGASEYLSSDVGPTISELTNRSSERFTADEQRSTNFADSISVFFALALLTLAVVQMFLSRRTRRTLSIPLLLATFVVVASFGASVSATRLANKDLRKARVNALAGISQLSKVRTEAYQLQNSNNRNLIGNNGVGAALKLSKLASSQLIDGRMQPGLLQEVNGTERNIVGQQLTEELFVRWQRYRSAIEGLQKLPTAVQSNSTTSLTEPFTGFNITVDSLLANDEARFFASYDSATKHGRGIPMLLLLGPLVAALLSMIGIQRRMNEYR
jgi:hypothetical protein